jgi:hypothetical protein
MAMRIRSREQLLNWLPGELSRLGRRSIVRAMEHRNGKVELLGGFSSIPPGNDPGWIVRVGSVLSGKKWHVAVIPRRSGVGIRLFEEVPWKLWVGGSTPLYNGDNPSIYKALKDQMVELENERT